jgi:hypothetical protein
MKRNTSIKVGDSVVLRKKQLRGVEPHEHVDVLQCSASGNTTVVSCVYSHDGERHVLQVPKRHLQPRSGAFNISDHVRLVSPTDDVLVPVGTEGVVLAGGPPYTVTFRILRTQGQGDVVVTQNQIPQDALAFVREPPSNDSFLDPSDGDGESSSIWSESEDADEDGSSGTASYPFFPYARLRSTMSPALFNQVVYELDTATLQKLSHNVQPGIQFRTMNDIYRMLHQHRS